MLEGKTPGPMFIVRYSRSRRNRYYNSSETKCKSFPLLNFSDTCLASPAYPSITACTTFTPILFSKQPLRVPDNRI